MAAPRFPSSPFRLLLDASAGVAAPTMPSLTKGWLARGLASPPAPELPMRRAVRLVVRSPLACSAAASSSCTHPFHPSSLKCCESAAAWHDARRSSCDRKRKESGSSASGLAPFSSRQATHSSCAYSAAKCNGVRGSSKGSTCASRSAPMRSSTRNTSTWPFSHVMWVAVPSSFTRRLTARGSASSSRSTLTGSPEQAHRWSGVMPDAFGESSSGCTVAHLSSSPMAPVHASMAA
eukprot:scaffold9266_cov110-Isochrysis_galbana.AAC.1